MRGHSFDFNFFKIKNNENTSSFFFRTMHALMIIFYLGSLLGTFTGHTVTEYRADCQMTMSKVYATCETGNIICWDLVSQKSVGRIPVRYA